MKNFLERKSPQKGVWIRADFWVEFIRSLPFPLEKVLRGDR